ncbi:MAG: hypothetical protein ABH823_03735 [bacterium]
MKFKEKQQSIYLRKLGKGYADILKVIQVSKGTLSRWLKGYPLTERQKAMLKGRAKSRYAGSKANQVNAQRRKKKIFETARLETKKMLGNHLFLLGLMLYWAEGTKEGGTVAFTNSDPKMIKIMMRWFRKICAVPEEKFRILVFIHSLQVNDNWREAWAIITGVPLSQFIKPFIKPSITNHRKNKLYNGTCAIRISSSDLLVRIKGWLCGLLELLELESNDLQMVR